LAYQILHPNAAPVQGVLFDLDGVILDSEKLYARFWAEACAFFGYQMTYQQALGACSLSKADMQHYLTGLFGPGIVYEDVYNKRVELMDAYTREHAIDAKPGVGALLDYLQERQIPYAITTSSPHDRVQCYLERLDLYRRFPYVCTTRETAKGKPEPDIYLLGAKTISVPPENCLALEDSHTGLLSAYRAGCMASVVPDLEEPGENILSIAYARFDSLLDVIPLLEEKAGKSGSVRN
jgi:HAD superfamily hydrolase (TIGR01509 family)